MAKNSDIFSSFHWVSVLLLYIYVCVCACMDLDDFLSAPYKVCKANKAVERCQLFIPSYGFTYTAFKYTVIYIYIYV